MIIYFHSHKKIIASPREAEKQPVSQLLIRHVGNVTYKLTLLYSLFISVCNYYFVKIIRLVLTYLPSTIKVYFKTNQTAKRKKEKVVT